MHAALACIHPARSIASHCHDLKPAASESLRLVRPSATEQQRCDVGHLRELRTNQSTSLPHFDLVDLATFAM
jgi:hypothetical protein